MTTHRIIIVVLGISLFLAGGCGSPEEKKANYLTLAEEYYQEGNFPKARVALRNVLKIDPNDYQGWYLYAQVEEKEKNWRKAIRNYLRVVELQPDHQQALLRLGKFYLQVGSYDKVLEVTKTVLAHDSDNVSAESLRAAVLANKGEMAEALSQAEHLVANHPTDPDPSILLASLYISQKRLPEALNTLQTALQENPHHIPLLNHLVSTAKLLKNHSVAEAGLNKIIEIEPTVFDHRARLAGFYHQQGKHQAAQTVFQQVITQNGDDEQPRLALAELLVLQKDHNQAEAILLQAKDDLPHSMNIRFALGHLYERQGHDAKAAAIYHELVEDEDDQPAGLRAQVRLATINLKNGQEEQANSRLQAVLEKNPRASEALLLKGRMALAHKDSSTAIQSFRTVLKDQPQHSPSHTLLGKAYLLSDQVPLARESLEKAVTYDSKAWEAQRLLARLDVNEGNPEKARERLNALLQEQPRDLKALGMLLSLQTANQDWGHTTHTLQQIREAGATPYATEMTEAQLHMAKKEWDQARTIFERLSQSHPEDPAPLFGLVQIDLKQENQQKAKTRLTDILSQDPKNAYARGILGEILVLQRDIQAAAKEFQQAYTLKPTWATPWLNHATIQIAQGKQEEALDILRTGVQVNPRAIELRMLLATSLTDSGKTDRAIEEYEDILAQNPKASVAANNLATLLTDLKGDPSSLERALVVTEGFDTADENPFFLDTRGWIYHKMGRNEEAIRIIKRALAKAPNHPVLNYHLGMAYYQLGNSQEAHAYLTKAVEADQQFEGIDEAQSILQLIQS